MSRHAKQSTRPAKRAKRKHVKRPKVKVILDDLAEVHPHAAGLDLSTDEIWVCVPSDRDPEPVRVFGSFTPDLQALVDWLVQCRIDTVAMESTGVYWIPIYELLEARGIKPYLVNAKHVKNVPGRKTECWTASGCRSGIAWACGRPRSDRMWRW